MKSRKIKQAAGYRESPYTPHTAEAAIAHLERVLSAAGADSLFSQAYWRARIEQVSATKGLTPLQRARLVRLLTSLSFQVRGNDPP
ncbi:hypothetical protein E1N52_04565 [Paraburkholderia guartelaensis]|uniref:Uncharacterized protein n=1 Tax=Paraburkholderia guartelaensis TaxID=2546446 RepID=A0A4R5LJJ8_9BURK|nr:hypothetical protein [Paraburkholderia guartelaensis]TDG09800.1 hypothetical protein E1N52_04565 [Paraburkholderia guartelaensis]